MMRSTSTLWSEIINYDDFTIYFARPSMLPDLIRTFQRYTKPIGLQFEKTISLNNRFTALVTLTNLTRLEVEPTRYFPNDKQINSEDKDHFTALKALQKLSFNKASFTPYILRHFPNLTHINIKDVYALVPEHLKKRSVKTNIISKLRNPTRLRSLDIYDNREVLAFDAESVAKMSNVSKVSIGCRGVLFPFSKLPNLESLTIESDELDDFSVNTKLTWLSIDAREKMELKLTVLAHDYQQLTALTNLKVLNLSILINEDEYSFLRYLTNLESLTVEEKGFATLSGQYLQFVNSTKLTNINVLAPTKVEYIAHLTNLREIQYLLTKPDPTSISFKFTSITSLTTRHISMAKYCPNLRSLSVEDPDPKPIDCKILASLSQLESLGLCKIDNSTLTLIGELTNLTQLKATYDLHHHYDFEVLSKLTTLKYLTCRSNKFYDTNGTKVNVQILRHLTDLETLQFFSLDDEAIPVLESLPRLKHLVNVATVRLSEGTLNKCSTLTNLQTLKCISAEPKFSQPLHECKLMDSLTYLYDCSL